MLIATREILLEKLLLMPALIDTYQRNDVGFAAKATGWLLELEQVLNRLRSPLTSVVANERGRIVAAQDGFCDSTLNGGRVSRRRRVNVTASLALGVVEAALVVLIQEIDKKTDIWREKLAQFISVASISVPIPLPPTDPRQDWLRQIWRDWQRVEEARAMHNYLNTIMAPGDRLHLLGELLDNHLNGNGS
ncbi:MAG: hypothetical protein L3J63_04350 [Geopsychrobacter sp.]|nr:hypothetical protein [Geopsychrobacter sp.]